MTKHYATLDGIKRAAIKLKRSSGLSHSAALEKVARDAGFRNYHTAVLAHSAPQNKQRFPVTISEFWSDRSRGERGTESRTFFLDLPLEDLVRPHHLAGYLGGATLKANELVGYGDSDSIERARAEIWRMARALQFMAATGLKPTRSRRCYPKGDWDNRPPGADHDQGWYDPKTRSYVLTEEPYPGRFDLYASEREQWASKHRWRSLRCRWGSLYGHGTELYLTGPLEGGVDLHALVGRLASSPPPYDEDQWSGEKHASRRGPPASERGGGARNAPGEAPLDRIEVIEMSPELSSLLNHQREQDIAEAGPQAPEATVEYRGVSIESRWSIAHELDTMRRMVDAMPDYVRPRLQSIWCDSKACAFYTIDLAPGRWLQRIEHPVREAVLEATNGFNGLVVRGDGHEIWFDPEWEDEDF